MILGVAESGSFGNLLKKSSLAFGLATALLCGILSPQAVAALPAKLANGDSLPSLAPMLERVTPTVVNIATYTNVPVRNRLQEHPLFGQFFRAPSRRQFRRTQSAGSGVVVDASKGYLVTNNHVVDRADEISVTLADGRTLSAQVVGVDPQVDLAVLQVEAKALAQSDAQIEFSDSQSLRVGDFVVAIGNPFGLSQTVTSGIISALGRTGLGIEGYEDLIQTDASINPGNSGGALVDLHGRLVGLNTAIYSPSGGNVGIGFAIPANMVLAIMEQLIEHGTVQRGYLGLSVQGLNSDLAEAFGVKRTDGVVVVEVEPGSVAADADLRAGDILLKVGDREIKRVSDFHSQAAITFVGDSLPTRIVRNGRSKRVVMRVSDDNLDEVTGGRFDPRLTGVDLQDFRETSSAEVGAGVVVAQIEKNCKAWRSGLRAGDVVVAVNRRPVQNLADLRESIRTKERQLLLRVYRAGRFGYVTIR